MPAATLRFAAAIVATLLLAAPSQASVPQQAQQYRSAITRSAQFHFGLPAPVPVLAAQVMQESAFNPSARSHVGAQGLSQFMPATAKWVGDEIGAPAAPLNPAWAIYAQHWYMAHLLGRVQHAETECDRWMLGLAAYNGGERRVLQRQALSKRPGSWEHTGRINPGIAPHNQRENEQYSPRIVHHWQPKFTSWGGRKVCLG